jgi:hypothetical protein
VGVVVGVEGRVGVVVGEGVKVIDGEREGVLTEVAVGIPEGEIAQLASKEMKIAADSI